MPASVKINGVSKVIKALERKIPRERKVSVSVGYTQNYAIYVHERTDLRHERGQAKYLEEPFRRMNKELENIIRTNFKATDDLRSSLILAGLRLQRESQLLVPVDTGALKASAFTRADDK